MRLLLTFAMDVWALSDPSTLFPLLIAHFLSSQVREADERKRGYQWSCGVGLGILAEGSTELHSPGYPSHTLRAHR